MASITPAMRGALTTHSGDVPVLLLTISHPDMNPPIRVVNDDRDITSEGNLFTGLPIEIGFPVDTDKRPPNATIRISNLGREMTKPLHDTLGGKDAVVEMGVVMRNAPNTVAPRIELVLRDVSVSQKTVEGTISQDDLNAPLTPIRITPETQPGAFS